MAEAIDDVERHCGGPDGRSVIAALLNLEAVSRAHFVREEELMRASGYPLVDEHARKHDQLLRLLLDLIEMARSEPAKCDAAFIQLLRDWKQVHIETSDADYVAEVRRHLDAGGV